MELQAKGWNTKGRWFVLYVRNKIWRLMDKWKVHKGYWSSQPQKHGIRALAKQKECWGCGLKPCPGSLRVKEKSGTGGRPTHSPAPRDVRWWNAVDLGHQTDGSLRLDCLILEPLLKFRYFWSLQNERGISWWWIPRHSYNLLSMSIGSSPFGIFETLVIKWIRGRLESCMLWEQWKPSLMKPA